MSAEILWTAAEAKAATRGMGPDHWRATGVSIDTRSIAAGDLFVALSGPNHDAHAFVGEALAQGAVAAVVARRPEGPADASLLLVPDTLAALRDLGAAARARSGARVAAVTGSTGKTSTKELLAAACAALGPTHAAAASYNNHWGVPLTLARLPRSAEWAVCEIGMNHAGEIGPLSRLVLPNVAVITNIGVAHLEYLGSREAIADAKAEIFEGLEPGGTAVLPRDDDFYERLAAAAQARGAAILGFGGHSAAEVRLLAYEAEGGGGGRVEAEVLGRRLVFRVPIAGRHQAGNAMAALAAVAALGGDPEQAAAGLERLRPLAGRGARGKILLPDGGSATLLDESYNANPQSVAAALAVLGETVPRGAGRRIAVLGDMLELGFEAPGLHAGLAEHLEQARAERVFLCGPLMRSLAEVLPADLLAHHAPDSAALAPLVVDALRDGDVVLVKGSLGSRMKRVVEALQVAGRPLPRAANGN